MATVSVETADAVTTVHEQDVALPAHPFIPQSPAEYQAAQEEFEAGSRTLAYVECRQSIGAGAISGYETPSRLAVFFPKDHFGHYGLEALDLARQYLTDESVRVTRALWFYNQAILESWTKQQPNQGQGY